MEVLKESPLYQELTALAREETLETERLAHLQNLQRLIAYRYKVSTDYFGTQLRMLDINTIKSLIDRAFDLESLAAFEAALAQYVQNSTSRTQKLS